MEAFQTKPRDSAPSGTHIPLLSLRGVSKCFGEIYAVRDASMDIVAGRIHCLLGENGAGKSTLMCVLAGRYKADAGEILLNGRSVRFDSPAQALAAGIGMVYQRFMLVPSFTVAENLLLGGADLTHTDAGARPGMLARLLTPRRVAVQAAQRLAARFGFDIDAAKPIATCSMAERQKVEILKALSRDARVLVLDEPTAILSPPEVEGLFATLDRLRSDGRAIVFITHKLREVEAVADEITILRQGRVVLRNRPLAEIGDRREIARAMLGPHAILRHESPESSSAQAGNCSELLLDVQNLSGRDGAGRQAFSDVSLTIGRGEIVAIVGVTGNGQSELAAAIAGFAPFASGRIALLGRAGAPDDNPDIAYVPADRFGTATVPELTLVENFLLGQPHGGAFLDQKAAYAATKRLIAAFGVQAAGPDAPANALSAGNLQRFILGRELSKSAALLVVDNPTQGLDIAASQEVRRRISDAARGPAKAGVLLVATDLDEALQLADRVVVMAGGRVMEILELHCASSPSGRSEADAELLDRIGMRMAGFAASSGGGAS